MPGRIAKVIKKKFITIIIIIIKIIITIIISNRGKSVPGRLQKAVAHSQSAEQSPKDNTSPPIYSKLILSQTLQIDQTRVVLKMQISGPPVLYKYISIISHIPT